MMTPRILTPAEYRDAYLYMQKQRTRAQIIEVQDLIAPHLVLVEAEQVRLDAIRRYADTLTAIARRRRDAVAEAGARRVA